MPEDVEQDGLVNDDPGVTGDDGDDLLSVVSLEGDEGDGEERGTDKGKKEPTSVKDMDPEVLAAHLARAQEHINNLNKALHEERQAKKKAAEKSGEPAFTKAQLKELWTEHRDDPDVLFNILSYMADETARSAQAKAVDQVELVNKKKEVDDYLAQNFPDLANDSSPLRAGVDKAKQELMLTDHPFGDILALGLNNLLNLPQTVKAAYEMGKKEPREVLSRWTAEGRKSMPAICRRGRPRRSMPRAWEAKSRARRSWTWQSVSASQSRASRSTPRS